MSIDELKTDGTECCIGARLEWRCDHKQKRACTIFLVVQALFAVCCRDTRSYLGMSASSNRTYPALDNRTIGVSVAAGIPPGRSAP